MSTQLVSTSFSTSSNLWTVLKGILDWVNLQFFQVKFDVRIHDDVFSERLTSSCLFLAFNLRQEKKTSIENYWCDYYLGFSFWFICFGCIVSSVLIQNFLCLCKIWRGPSTIFYVSLLVSVRMNLSCLRK